MTFLKVLFFIVLIMGCNEVKLNVAKNFISKVELLSTQYYQFSGVCDSSKRYLITTPVRQEISCINNRWSFNLDKSMLPVGEVVVTFEDVSLGTIASMRLAGGNRPAHLLSQSIKKNTSVIKELYHSKDFEPLAYLTYASDEFCGGAECLAINIAIRLRSENYLTPYHLTSSTTLPSSNPRSISIGNGLIRTFFLSTLDTTQKLNLFYVDFDVVTKTPRPIVRVTSQNYADITNYTLVDDGQGIYHLYYISNEYCALNSCTAPKISWRNSADNFQSLAFLGTHTQCSLSQLKGTANRASGAVYLAYHLASSGSCVSTTTNEVMIASLPTPTMQQFSINHFGGAEIAVDSSGVVHLFYYSTWEGTCGAWRVITRNSTSNYATGTMVSGSCPSWGSYHSDVEKPAVATFPDGSVKFISLTSATSPAESHVSSSSDAFSSFTSFDPGSFIVSRFYAQVFPLSDGFEHFYVEGSGKLVRFIKRGTDSRVEIIKELYESMIATEFNGQAAFIGLSDEYCLSRGCNSKNYYLQLPSTTEKIWLTQITTNDISLSYPMLLRSSPTDYIFFYSSTELFAGRMNIHSRALSTNFAVRSDYTNSSTVDNYVTDSRIDLVTGDIHLATYENGLYHRSSSNGYIQGSLINGGSLGGVNFQIAVSASQDVGILYGGNESGGWRSNIRWSTDSFAARQYTIMAANTAYRNRDIDYDSARNLQLFYIADENADGKNELIRRTSLDTYASTTNPFLLTNESLCQNQTGWNDSIAVATDLSGVTYVLYSAKKDGSNSCQLKLRASDDWTKIWDISKDKEFSSIEPTKIILRTGRLPIVCGKTLYSTSCFDMSNLPRI